MFNCITYLKRQVNIKDSIFIQQVKLKSLFSVVWYMTKMCLLVGVLVSTDSLECNLAVLSKIKNVHTLQPRNFTSGIYPRQISTTVHQEALTRVFLIVYI